MGLRNLQEKLENNQKERSKNGGKIRWHETIDSLFVRMTEKKRMLHNVLKIYPKWSFLFSSTCVLMTNISCSQNSESNFETTNPDFFFKKFVVCFNLIKAVFSSNARKMRVTSLSFNLELWFVTWFCAENCFDQIRTINNEIPQLMWVLLTTVYTTKQILKYNNT